MAAHTTYAMPSTEAAPAGSDTTAVTLGLKGRVQHGVVRLISKRPCASFCVTLVLALLLGAVGIVFGGMSIDTDGWETRGTPLADRAIQYEVWRTGNFEGPLPNGGVPVEKGTKEEDRRRRARSLLGVEDGTPGSVVERAGLGRFGLVAGGRRLDDAEEAPSSARVFTGRRLSETSGAAERCAVPVWPDDANRFNPANLQMIFYDASVDLWSPEGMAATCEAEDAIMAMSGYAERCEKASVACDGPTPDPSLGPGLAASFTDAGNGKFTRCITPVSYARFYMASLGLKSCSAFLGNATVTAKLEEARVVMKDCAAKFRARKDQCGDKEGFDAGGFNADFGLESSRMTVTKSTFRMHNYDYEGTMSWLAAREQKGELNVRRAEFKVAYNTQDSALKDRKVDEALNQDMVLSAIAVFVVLGMMWLHTGSMLLTVGGLLQVLLAFPTAVFLTTCVFQITFFPFLNFIGIFVIAGVGADDCFVMYDKWIQAKSRLPKFASAGEVASACYWDATWAMFLTSVTTAAAFVSSAIIPIAPIRVFSIFMASMIMFDYIFDITVFAACVAFQHRLLVNIEMDRAVSAGREGCCSLMLLDFWTWLEQRRGPAVEINRKLAGAGARDKSQRGFDAATKRLQNAGALDASFRVARSPPTSKVSGDGSPAPGQREAAADGASDGVVPNQATGPLSERVFHDKVYPVIHFMRWPLIFVLLALGAVAIWAASGLKPPEDNDVLLLGRDDPLEQFGILERTAFLSSSEGQLWVSVVFGLQASDDGDHTNPQDRPSLKLDPNFDPTSTEAQTWFTDFCTATAARTTEWNCPVLQWSQWVTEGTSAHVNWTACVAAASENCEGKFRETVGDVSPDDFAAACGTAGFPVPANTMERCMYKWARNKDKKTRMSFYWPSGAASTDENARIFFLRANFASNISWTSPLGRLQDDHAQWEDYVSTHIAKAPPGLAGGYQTSEAWWWMDTIDNMQMGAYSAAGITLLLAAVVILLGTGNAVVTLYSVIAIAVILAATVACVVGMGWTLGFLEGICFSILIGLSVDFIIHIGHGYVSAMHASASEVLSRAECAREALAKMGFPVLSAGCTTLMSAIVLFFCQITFFNKFGTIVMLSMLFSTVITFMLFVPLLDASGPQGKFGEVAALCTRWSKAGKT